MITTGTEKLYHFIGLSTDTKPVDPVKFGVPFGNGSVFTEMDTSKDFVFDAQHKTWILRQNGGVQPMEIVAGEGLKLEGNVISIDTEVVPEKQEVVEIVNTTVPEVVPEVIPQVLVEVDLDGGEIE